jgi:CHAT domain
MPYINILVLAANPKNTTRLRLDEEVREIENGLQRARKRDEFALKQVWAARPIDIRRAMLDLKPQLVHFLGHGTGETGIAFEDEMGNTKLVDTETLAGFFELFSDKVECVILNACYSENQADAIAKHIKYVVGMRKGISDKAAIEFSTAFYDALGAGETVEFAFKLACNAIQWAGLLEHMTPILKIKSDNEKQFNLIYDSQQDKNFEQWTIHSSTGMFEGAVQFNSRELDNALTLDMETISTASVGGNKSLRLLYGKVDFEYKIVYSKSVHPNIYFCMIPMQETSIGRTGLIEVGTNIQSHHKNPHSPYRKRFYAPMEFYNDGQWHHGSIDFDFRKIPTAFYSIFAPRINEGCSQPAAAHVLTAQIKVYALE